MMSFATLPLCAARLGWNFTKFEEPAMNEYWAAVIVADFCHDEALAEYGGFNFEDRSVENGKRLLSRLEQCIRAKKHKVQKFVPPEDLKALLGSRGVKTSELKTADDFWNAAETLFHGFIHRVSDINAIAWQIRKIDKKKRKALADANLRKLPVEWLSKAENHARKLQ